MARIIVTAPGSLGDVNPLLAIARGLSDAGYDVLLLASERYLPLAQAAGLDTRSLVSERDFQRMANDPDIWHPVRGPTVIFRHAVGQFLNSHYEWLDGIGDPKHTVLVSHILDFAGRIYRDRHPEARFVSVLPAPSPLRSHREPPRLSSHRWERWIPRTLMPAFYRAADAWIARAEGGQINRLRASLGLPPVRRLLDRWWWSPDLVLCLFPEWFSIPARDLLPQMRLTGFPLADSGDWVDESVARETRSIVDRLAPRRPIVFAPGSAHHHAADFLQSASEACRRLERHGILLSSDASQFPAALPDGVVTARYLPFGQILPHASAIVHHGGVGTTSQSFRAGIPQLVMPMAFDQFDNADRVARLGCGSWTPMARQSPERLARLLTELPQCATRTAEIAGRIPNGSEAVAAAVRWIGELVHGDSNCSNPLA